MDEEKISCEAETIYSGYKWKAILTLTICAWFWTQDVVQRGNWAAEAVPGLVQAAQMLKIFWILLAVPNIVLIDILVGA